jgi:hypothetical protein
MRPSPTFSRWLVLAALVVPLLTVGNAHAQAAPDWQRLDRALDRQAASGALLVAEVTDGACAPEPLHAWHADQRLAIASTFKFYVLAELVRQIETGHARWDERIPIQDAYRSMPSGDFAFTPEGTRVTLEALATAMIAQSDNTATDHLIARLGRLNVEAAFARAGHGAPEINMPLLLTRELFAIKMRQPERWMRAYADAGDAEQRAMLADDIDPMRLDPYGGWGNWNGPTHIDAIEWFASAAEVCDVVAALYAQSHTPELAPLRDILFSSTGGVARHRAWRELGFKAGYEAGVVNLTWLVERDDGRAFVVTVGLNDPKRIPDGWAVRDTLAPVWACLAQRDACQ